MGFVAGPTIGQRGYTESYLSVYRMQALVAERNPVAAQWHHLHNALLASQEMSQRFGVEEKIQKAAPILQ